MVSYRHITVYSSVELPSHVNEAEVPLPMRITITNFTTVYSHANIAFHDIQHKGGRRHLAASVALKIPVYREYLLWLGCVDASRPIAEKVSRLICVIAKYGA